MKQKLKSTAAIFDITLHYFLNKRYNLYERRQNAVIYNSNGFYYPLCMYILAALDE